MGRRWPAPAEKMRDNAERRAVLGWGLLTAGSLAVQWYDRTLDTLLERIWGPATAAFLERDLRVSLKIQYGHYIWCFCRCRGLREDLWNRLGTAVLARAAHQLPAAARYRLDQNTLREWLCRPTKDYLDWDERACRQVWYEDLIEGGVPSNLE